MTDATPTQPTGSGKWIWCMPLLRDVVEFGTAPDPRDLTIAALRESLEAAHRFGIANHERAERADARIAELEAALRNLPAWKARDIAHVLAQNAYFGYGAAMLAYADAFMPPPEGDMRETVEELDA